MILNSAIILVIMTIVTKKVPKAFIEEITFLHTNAVYMEACHRSSNSNFDATVVQVQINC
jgi:hypothetical protein